MREELGTFDDYELGKAAFSRVQTEALIESLGIAQLCRLSQNTKVLLTS
jgi:hypothetical protein